MSAHREALKRWLNTKSIKTEKVLDIGGVEWSVRGSVGVWEVDSYTTLGEKTGDIILNLNETLVGKIPFADYDVVFCLEVMQFVYDPMRVLENLNWVLQEKGKLFITFHRLHPPMKSHDYLRYTKAGVLKLLDKNDFKIVEVQEPIEGYYLIEACLKF